MFEAELVQGNTLKKILESIKELITDASFDCSSTGIVLQAMDSAHVSLVHLLLKSDGFDKFRCDKNLSLGVNMVTVSKMLRSVSTDDSITIKAMEDGDTVTFIVKSKDGDSTSEFELKLVEIETDQLGIPESDYSAVIKMPSAKFKKICADMALMGDTCTISTSKKGVTFSAKGEDISGSTTIKQAGAVDDEDSTTIDSSESISLTFALKYLNIFCKSAALSNTVTLSLSNEAPLQVEYKMKELGHIRYYLAPKIDEDGENDEE